MSELTYSDQQSKEILAAFGLRLQLAARLAEIRNDTAPVIEARKALPKDVREAFGMPPEAREEFPSTNHCKCGKVISRNKIRCLVCQVNWLAVQQRAAQKEEAKEDNLIVAS